MICSTKLEFHINNDFHFDRITQLTHSITSTVSSLTEELTEELSPILAFVSRWS